jgi:hypothetical protein
MSLVKGILSNIIGLFLIYQISSLLSLERFALMAVGI